jgi:hypothetical protein
MTGERFNWPLFLARLEVGGLPPEQVSTIAIEALQAGSDSPTLVILAGLSTPTMLDLEELLPRLLSEIGQRWPSETEALKLLGDDLLRKIVDGEINPYTGGRRLGTLWRRQSFREEHHALWEQFVQIYGVADEIDDDPASRQQYERDILDAARARIALGGFSIE